jgi:hypothetical protein
MEEWFKTLKTILNQIFHVISTHYSILPVFHPSTGVAAGHLLSHIDSRRLKAPESEPLYFKQTSCRWFCI